MRKRPLLFAFGALLLASRPARADKPWMKVFVSPGVVASWAFSPDTASGAGFELSGGYFDSEGKLGFHAGGVYRGQGYDTGPWGSFGRHTLALEAGLLFFGAEVGWAIRDEFPLARGTSGLHIAPYATLGLLYFGPQFLIPVTTAGSVEVALNLGIKLPLPQTILIPLYASFGNMGSGRPLRVGGEPRAASVRDGRGWRRGAAPRVDHLDPHARSLLAAEWATEGRAEHASVATFAKLTLELLAIGAPASLVRRAQRAAADEIRHAEICFRIASAYGGADIEPGPIDAVVQVRKPTLARMAVEAYIDGCIGEGLAAAAAAARESDDPAVRAATRTIARDEARHAALGRAIVRYCTRRGGTPVRAALRRARARLKGLTRPAA